MMYDGGKSRPSLKSDISFGLCCVMCSGYSFFARTSQCCKSISDSLSRNFSTSGSNTVCLLQPGIEGSTIIMNLNQDPPRDQHQFLIHHVASF